MMTAAAAHYKRFYDEQLHRLHLQRQDNVEGQKQSALLSGVIVAKVAPRRWQITCPSQAAAFKPWRLGSQVKLSAQSECCRDELFPRYGAFTVVEVEADALTVEHSSASWGCLGAEDRWFLHNWTETGDVDELSAAVVRFSEEAPQVFQELIAGTPSHDRRQHMYLNIDVNGDLLQRVAARHKLNQGQISAVADLIVRVIGLLHGPPGTGKTTTLCCLLEYLLVEGETIDLAAASHSAIDVVLRGLLEKVVPNVPCNIARLGHVSRSSDLRIKRLNVDGQVRETGLANPCKPSFRQCREELMTNCSVLAGTPVALSRAAHKKAAVIDEAAQLTMPATMCPINANTERLVLAGDPRQLPPTTGPRASFRGLGSSMLESFCDRHFPINTLCEQYRMVEDIMKPPNAIIYKGILVCADSVKKEVVGEPAGFPWPGTSAVFIHVDGREEQASCNFSKFNTQEAIASCRIGKALLAAGVSAADIGVITPYAAQAELIKCHLGNNQLYVGTSVNATLTKLAPSQ